MSNIWCGNSEEFKPLDKLELITFLQLSDLTVLLLPNNKHRINDIL